MFRKVLIVFLFFLLFVPSTFSDSLGIILKSGVFTTSDFKIPGSGPDDLAYRSPFSIGGFCSEYMVDIVGDVSGDVYITGYLSGDVSFGSSVSLAGHEESDTFVAKFDSFGAVQWVKILGGDGHVSGHGIASDNLGNVYLVVNFCDTIRLGSETFISSGKNDVLIVSFDSFGETRWVKRFGDDLDEFSGGIVVDGLGSIYIAATSFDSVLFGSDVFVVKFRLSGEIQWVRNLFGHPVVWCSGVDVDGAGNVYLTGIFNGPAVFDTVWILSEGEDDIFVLKMGSSGTVQWAKSFGGSRSEGHESIAVDNQGCVYVVGFFYDTIRSLSLSSLGEEDMFIVKLDPFGGVQWGRSFGSDVSGCCFSVAVDDSVVWVVGYFAWPITFDTFSFHSPNQLDDVFVIGLNSDSGSVVAAEAQGASSKEFKLASD